MKIDFLKKKFDHQFMLQLYVEYFALQKEEGKWFTFL